MFTPDDIRGTLRGGPSLVTFPYGPRGYVDRGLDWQLVGWTGRSHRHDAVRLLDAVDPVEEDVDEDEQDAAVGEDDVRQEAELDRLVEEQLVERLRAWREAEGLDELGELILTPQDYAEADADPGGFDAFPVDDLDVELPPRRTSDEAAS
jgi:hypothetical protein